MKLKPIGLLCKTKKEKGMDTATIYLLFTIVFLIGCIGVGLLPKRDFHKLKCLDSQCYKFTEEEFNCLQTANIRVQRTLTTPKIIHIPTNEIINNGVYLLNKEGFRILKLDEHL